MIARIIDASIANRLFIVLAAIAVTLGGFWAVRTTPVDALPDLSDVAGRRPHPATRGQAPRIVEDQVTYPAGHDHAVGAGREDGARLLVVRRQLRLCESSRTAPTSTGHAAAGARISQPGAGTGCRQGVPQRARSGRDRAWGGSTNMRWSTARAATTLPELRGLQDWFLRYELKTVPGVAEVASVGGMVKQYQVRARSLAELAAYRRSRMPQSGPGDPAKSNQEAGGSVRGDGRGRIHGPRVGLSDDARTTSGRSRSGPPPAGCRLRLGDVATIQVGPELRRGIAELNGAGEVAGGVVVPAGQGADARRNAIAGGRGQAGPTCRRALPTRRRGGDGLRPFAAHRIAAVENLTHQADRGVHRRRDRHAALFLWHVTLGAGRDPHPAAWACWRRSS